MRAAAPAASLRTAGWQFLAAALAFLAAALFARMYVPSSASPSSSEASASPI